MKILFAGFRHGHIFDLYQSIKKRTDIEIAACIEPDERARAAAEARLDMHCDTRDYAYWLTQDVDIVAIGARYGDRGGMILQGLRAGKHILSDKPICTTPAELDAIKQEIGQKGLKLGCMLDLRYLPSTAAAREVLRGGSLGEVRNISFSGQHCIDYANRPPWYFEAGMHGGTVNDLAIHGIDLVKHLTGLKVHTLNAVRTWNAYAHRNPEFKDCALFMATLNNGAGLLADVSYSAPSQVFHMPTYWNFKLWCERGMLTFCATDPKAYVYREGGQGAEAVEAVAAYDYIAELLAEIKNGTTAFTDSVLEATEQTMNIQKAADVAI